MIHAERESTVEKLPTVVIVGLDHVIVCRLAAKVVLCIGGLGAFLALIQPPVLPIEIEMVEPTAGVGLAHFALNITAEYLAYKGVLVSGITGSQTPGVVLGRAQVEIVKRVYALVPKQGEAQG